MVKNENLIIYLSSSLRTALFFEKESKTFKTHTHRLYNIIQQLLHEENDDITIDINNNYLFINNERVEISLEIMGVYRILVNDLSLRGIGKIIFRQGLLEEELKNFAFIVGRSKPLYTNTFDGIFEKIREEGISNITIGELEEFESVKEAKETSLRKEAIKNFLNGIFYLKESAYNTILGTSVKLGQAKKIIRGFIDLITEDEDFIIGLTTIKNIGSYTLNHSVNVSILSIAMGLKLNLQRKDVIELGIAGLFHDIGKIEIPETIIDKPGPLTPTEYSEIKKHPHLGVEKLILIKHMQNIPAFAIRGILEHHIDYDGSGYPPLNIETPSLFARIIRVVDTYDAMTTPRVYQDARSPFEAIQFISQNKEKKFDPKIVDRFIELVGIFPPGTIVEIDTGEVGIVYNRNTVILIGKQSKKINVEKLGRKIQRVLTPEEAGLDPSSVFIALGLKS